MNLKSLLWISDPHLNFLRYRQTGHDNDTLLKKVLTPLVSGPKGVGVLLTGDISESNHLVHDLLRVVKHVTPEVPIFYILGNHDFYRGSLEGTRKMLVENLGLVQNLHYLTVKDPLDLGNGVVLTGHDGLYDCRAGFAEESNLLMSDFQLIGELRRYYAGPQHMSLIGFVRQKSKEFALEAKESLLKAVAMNPQKVLFATHYPPFTGACWHRGAISDGNWLPWFTSLSMGEVLAEVAFENPGIQFEVYCGHTHSPGVYKHLPNLVVYTASAEYGEIHAKRVEIAP